MKTKNATFVNVALIIAWNFRGKVTNPIASKLQIHITLDNCFRYANCQCSDCIMVEERRQLNNQLNPRRLDPDAPRPLPGEKKKRDPKCARCKAHCCEKALRGHKKNLCPFNECNCERVSTDLISYLIVTIVSVNLLNGAVT
jgi:hypothetical protein